MRGLQFACKCAVRSRRRGGASSASEKTGSKKKAEGKTKGKNSCMANVDGIVLAVNPAYEDPGFMRCYGNNSEAEPFPANVGGVRSFQKPFRCLGLPNFVFARKDFEKEEISSAAAGSFLQEIQKEISEDLDLNEKNNDLYKFRQSEDLSNCHFTEYPALCKAREFFSGPVREWMSRLTGIELRSDYVALTVSSYGYTDYLLCHDDELDERRLALVLYLTPNWKQAHGGTLDLFSSDEKGQPTEVRESIIPEMNLLSLFEVTERSFHQISEVIKDSLPRLSINGWFHGAPIPRTPSAIEAPTNEEKFKPEFVPYETVVSWINPVYFEESVQKEIREKFENDSEIELQNFFQEEKYELLFKEIMECKMFKGDRIVPNKRWYKRVLNTELVEESPMELCFRLFRSEAMFLLLSQLTGLGFHPLYESEEGKAEKEEMGRMRRAGSHPVGPTLVVSQAPTSPEAARKRRRSASPNLEQNGVVKRSKQDDTTSLGVLSPVLEGQSKNGAQEMNGESKAWCSLEFRKFQNGSYTLMHDSGAEREEEGCREDFSLDAQLFFTSDEWQPDHGGYTCYVAKGEDEELLTVSPKGNSLALVYRDPETMKFVKYVNHRVTRKFKSPGFCDLNATFFSS